MKFNNQEEREKNIELLKKFNLWIFQDKTEETDKTKGHQAPSIEILNNNQRNS